MEQDWNKLIERYLQNELSTEGKAAFELELQENVELRTELEIHQLIYASVFRSVDRIEIAQIAQSYHFKVRLKKWLMFTSIIVGISLIASIFYLSNDTVPNDKKSTTITKLNNPENSNKETTIIASDSTVKVDWLRANDIQHFETPKIENKNSTPSNIPADFIPKVEQVKADDQKKKEEKLAQTFFLLKGTKHLQSLMVTDNSLKPSGDHICLGEVELYTSGPYLVFYNANTGNILKLGKPYKNTKRRRVKKYNYVDIPVEQNPAKGNIFINRDTLK